MTGVSSDKLRPLDANVMPEAEAAAATVVGSAGRAAAVEEAVAAASGVTDLPVGIEANAAR